jgi:drug/metabolite transporter (DMT)-like permease
MTAELSVGLRFLMASLVLELYRLIFDSEKTKLSFKDWQFIILQGIFLYSINFWLCYYSSQYMVSGLIAVTVSTMIIPNLIFGKLFLGIPFRIQVVGGAFLGILGVCTLYLQELLTFTDNLSLLKGFLLAFLSTFFSVIGTQASGILSKRGVPVILSVSRALFVGGLLSLSVSLMKDGVPILPRTAEFWGSLIYLGIISSAMSYTLYGYLIKKYGPGVASYLWIASPAISLALSALFETYDWTAISSMGIVCIIVGGILTGSKSSLWSYFKTAEFMRFLIKSPSP